MKITKHATDDTSYFNSGKICNLQFTSLTISISNPKRWCCESTALNLPANLENSAVATGLEKSVFIPIPNKGYVKECSNYHTTALISHASKVKFPKLGFSSTWTENFQMFKLDLEKAEEPEITLSTSVGSKKKQESSRETSTSALLTMTILSRLYIVTLLI